MISRAEFDAYNAAAAALADEAERIVVNDVLAWCKANPGASISDCRAYAAETMRGMLPVYDDAAATIAADWYDERAFASGKSLKPAVTATAYDDELIEKTTRYQAKKLAGGDMEGFAASCGELARNDAMKSLNETMRANCRRDEPEGVMFARVPTGYETCTFCLRLASYGAIYASRKAAGEFNHYHRRCDCKVVPCFEGDPMGELVEGASPADSEQKWLALKSIDERPGLSSFERQLLKNRAVGKRGSVEIERSAAPLPKEEGVISWLTSYGLDIVFRETRSDEKKRTSDLLIGGIPWEIKQPTGNGSQTIYHQFEEAAGQSDRLIIDMSALEGSRWDWDSVADVVKKYLRYHFKDGDGNIVQFRECLLIDESRIKHIRKGS